MPGYAEQIGLLFYTAVKNTAAEKTVNAWKYSYSGICP